MNALPIQNIFYPKVYDLDAINKDRRILLVDDEPYNIMGLKIILI